MGKNYQSSTPFLWLHRLFIAPHLPLERDLKWSLVLSGSLFIAPHLPLETWLIKPLRLLQTVCNVAAHSHCKSVIYHVLPSPPTLFISSLWRFSRLLLPFPFHLSDLSPSPPTLSISSLWPFPRLLLAFLLNSLTVRDMINQAPAPPANVLQRRCATLDIFQLVRQSKSFEFLSHSVRVFFPNLSPTY